MKQQALSITIFSLMLTACNGGDNNTTTTTNANTATGQFKDSNVAGLAYKSGSQSGTTNAKGEFTYEVGKPVTFSIGGLEFGSATGQAIVTPADLVDENDKNNSKATNIARVLQMLDEDGDPDNGISIVEASIKDAENWNKYDLHKTEADFEEDLKLIQADATASGNTHKIPSLEDTKAHLSKNMRCAYSGAYKGSFSGDDKGDFGILIKPNVNAFHGHAYSHVDKQMYLLVNDGIKKEELNKTIQFDVSSPTSNTPITFSGSVQLSGEIKGKWKNTEFDASGTFSGNRIELGKGSESVYRYTGKYGSFLSDDNQADQDWGMLAFDIDKDGKVDGLAYSLVANQMLKGSGSLKAGNLDVELENGTKVTAKVVNSDNNNKTVTWLDGKWSDKAGKSGWFYSEGCKLN